MRQRSVLLVLLLFLPACNQDNSPTTKTSLRYAALGASDAFGIGAEPRENGYVWLIQDWLLGRYDQAPLLNAGIPGVDADEILAIEVPLAVGHHPGVVTLWTGGNDITGGRDPGEFENDLRAILDRLRDETKARVFVADIPDLTVLPRYRQQPDPDVTTARIASFNAAIRRQVANHGAWLVALSATTLATDDTNISGDGFHPNNAGYRLIADTFVAVMAGNLPSRWTFRLMMPVLNP